MPPVMAAFLLSFGVIFVAELGDKSQLMALAFAARYKALPILVGITIAASRARDPGRGGRALRGIRRRPGGGSGPRLMPPGWENGARAGTLEDPNRSSVRSSMAFKVGDRVVYPHHGAAVIKKKESREV